MTDRSVFTRPMTLFRRMTSCGTTDQADGDLDIDDGTASDDDDGWDYLLLSKAEQRAAMERLIMGFAGDEIMPAPPMLDGVRRRPSRKPREPGAVDLATLGERAQLQLQLIDEALERLQQVVADAARDLRWRTINRAVIEKAKEPLVIRKSRFI
ncbi:hypothetical protein KEM52_006596, partial [Ascosphaera acerosa]